MRTRLIRATALALAALLTLGPAASASQALGTEIHMGVTHLAEGVDYTRQYLWSATYSDLRTERYLEYTPNELVYPVVAYGDAVPSQNTLSSLAKGLEAEGLRVLGGVNGDYYAIATGTPLGIVVTDGILRSSSAYHYALGFDAEGNAFIGQPGLSITATFGGYTLAVPGGLNKERADTGSYILYTEDYGPTTKHTEPGVDVILIPSADPLSQEEEADPGTEETAPEGDAPANAPVYSNVPVIGSRISCTVAAVLQSTGPIDIPEGCLVLSINNKSSEWLVSQLASLQEGDPVEIDITASDERWEHAVTAVGGLYKMVTDGVVESGLETTQAPRTAVGVRADGSVIFYTVDGRQSGYSVGASIAQVAERLVELGCVEAMCMDGGGSTTLGATLPGEDGFGVLNQPSDGSQRAVSNALFLVAQQAAVGEAKSLVLSPGDAMLLSGAQLELSAVSVDRLGQAVTRYNAAEPNFALPASGGSIAGGILTAGTQAGTYTLTADIGGLTGNAIISVVSNPDTITVRDEATGTVRTSLHLEPGKTLDLTAQAIYRNLPLTSQDTNFTWSVTEGLGAIDQNGTLTAGDAAGTGTVTVAAGTRSISIPLTVSGQIHTVESFEGDFSNMADSLTAQIEPERRSAYVHMGNQSARIRYDMGAESFAAVSLPLTFREDDKYLTLWVYGDGSGNTLSAPVYLADGSTSEQILAVLNFTGWQRVITTLPVGSQQILMLKITPTGSSGQGSVWLDQITASNQYVPDDEAPAVTVNLTGTTVSAVVQDNMGEVFPADRIRVTYDGRELEFTLDNNLLTANLPAQEGLAHRITVTATDASGNIGRGSVDIAATAERTPPFSDSEGHWAEQYIHYLYDQGISNGVTVGAELQFQPDKNITRGDFALMVARWLGLDLSTYSSVTLPFADTEKIPFWCVDAVKAMYSLGIMQGGAVGDALYIYAQNDISRAEAFTMLGRIQAKGYAAAELTFADAADIPSWAADYMATMVGQGVIGGYSDNTVAPNACIKRGEMAKILYTMR